MRDAGQTLIVLTPAFAASEGESWLPSQERLVVALNRNFPDVKIVVISFHFPERSAATYRWYGNEVIALRGAMKGGISSLLLWQKAWTTLNRIHRQTSVIGIFSFFCSDCAFVGHYFAKRFGLRHRIWVLGQDAREGNHQVRRIRPAADELVCISDFLVREFERNHRIHPAHVIPIAVDTTQFGAAPASRTIDLLGAGSLIPLKQFDVFIAVVAKIKAHIPNVQARICGDGPDAQTLTQLIEQSDLEDNLQLAGRLPHESVLAAMQQSKILLHTSSYEGFGAVCLEALYAGAHVISFCKPMDADITHWHIVQSEQDMVNKALALLSNNALNHNPVLPFEINKTAIEIMRLFDVATH